MCSNLNWLCCVLLCCPRRGARSIWYTFEISLWSFEKKKSNSLFSPFREVHLTLLVEQPGSPSPATTIDDFQGKRFSSRRPSWFRSHSTFSRARRASGHRGKGCTLNNDCSLWNLPARYHRDREREWCRFSSWWTHGHPVCRYRSVQPWKWK